MMGSGHSLTEETPIKDQNHSGKTDSRKFDFRSTREVEAQVPLKCLKGAAGSNLRDSHIWRSTEISGLET